MTPAGLLPPEFLAAVNRRVAAALAAGRDTWTGIDPELAGPFEALEEMVRSGGKRLRPAFCYWAFVGAGGRPDDPVILDAAAALELVHTMAVVHDDVMDDSERRHGVETIHVRFAARSRGRGEPRRFGEGVAILMGDVAHACADPLLAGAPPAAVEVFQRMRLEVNAGQCLDLLAAGRPPTVERARHICRYKTATYTVERPLQLGAALAAPARFADLAGPLSGYGAPLGEAFQLKDDLLGTFGDPATTGKPVGGDLREGKATLLVALAHERAGPAERRLLADRLGAPDLTGDDVERLQELIDKTGARHEVERVLARLVGQAVDAAGDLPLSQVARGELGRVARFVAGRDH